MIALRDVGPGDRERLRTWRNLPEVARHMYTDHAISEAEHAAWFARMMEDLNSRYWIVVAAGRDLGAVNLSHIDRRNGTASWGFYLAEPPHPPGRGAGVYALYRLADEAFLGLGLERLWAEALASNRRSIGVHEVLGFRREGVLRQHVVKDGKREDVVRMGLMRAEWDEARPRVRTWLADRGWRPVDVERRP